MSAFEVNFSDQEIRSFHSKHQSSDSSCGSHYGTLRVPKRYPYKSLPEEIQFEQMIEDVLENYWTREWNSTISDATKLSWW
ncbi:hypothetical protein Cob_v004897 [Colletotrichum orbiculare MAFF 240422]|uniref:Uncharacterized protein n=1 Tax=Colletotrichum orbiculare (strain 104-T / ATCC 96160 / CBS 514.97 / LARS 414 / MAFF 240422) TaxID=1213857 RepID=A0A484FWT0_COLOR|nr:hypothetical protein Cob_v004897 [Colletotrichum orbiculare MAFF 240422]